jgi:hypothetical protein
MLFDPTKVYQYRHLENAGIVRDRDDLKRQVDNFSFPTGRLLTPRKRVWTGAELNNHIETRPTTQADFDALPDRAPKSKPNIPKKVKA